MDDHLKQQLLLAREAYEKREYADAEKLLRLVLQQTRQFADVHDMLGVIAHTRGDLNTAKEHFENAVSINPNYTEAQLNLMVTLNDLGEYSRAREIYAGIRQRGSDGTELDPFAKGRIANMHAETSQAYVDAGMAVEAIAELEKAVSLCPKFADLRTKLGILYRDTGDLRKAREHFEAASTANPNYLQARIMLGVLQLTSGNNAGAVEEFERVLEFDPDNKAAQMYLRIAQAPLRGSSGPPADTT